jgi:predicted ATPase
LGAQAGLLERAGGNPLYAEEFARIALERKTLGGAESLPLPESVQGLIAARLDALSDEEKGLVQDASVLGKVFWLGAVAQLGGVPRDRIVPGRTKWDLLVPRRVSRRRTAR